MKFELNDYHRNVSDQEFILDVQETAKRLGKDTLTGEEYSLHGKYHSSTLTRRFGSWKKVLEKCSLETQGHNFKYDFSDEDVVYRPEKSSRDYRNRNTNSKRIQFLR